MMVYSNGEVDIQASYEATLDGSKRATATANEHYAILIATAKLLDMGDSEQARLIINNYLSNTEDG